MNAGAPGERQTRTSARDTAPPKINRERFPVDEWRLVERIHSSDDPGLTETLFGLGNGYLGLRGNSPEGRDAHEHGTFINGLHETWPIRHAENAYGFAEVGQTIVNAPDAKPIRLYVDDEPFDLAESEVLAYERSLDFADGVLRRTLVWVTPSGKRVEVLASRMVSFDQRHVAIMRLKVTVLDADALVDVSCLMLNRQDGQDEFGKVGNGNGADRPDPRKAEELSTRVFEPRAHWNRDGRSLLAYRTINSRMSVAVAADHHVETDNDYVADSSAGPEVTENSYRFAARKGVPITVTKVVAYHSGAKVPTTELANRCQRTLDQLAREGIEQQYLTQREWLDGFWARSDVEVTGEPEMQQAIRWNLFQLAQASARSDGGGIAAKGVSGSGYSGHYFWDSEVYVLPFLNYTNPRVARNALRFRHHMLPAARRRAAQLNERGALFPWRTINGEEASAYYAAGTAQYHIDADISYALAQYVRATGDVDFLTHEAIDIVVETARMWSSLGFWRHGEKNTFHIHGVTGPDEYTTVVNDNLFTNVMAKFNLSYAADAVTELSRNRSEEYRRLVERLDLDVDEIVEWRQAAEAMSIPFSDALGIHPQDVQFLDREMWDLLSTPPEKRPLLLHFHPLVIYRFQVLKQADVVLALFLRGNEFTAEEKLADFRYYDPITTGDSSLSAIVESIIAAEVGYRGPALRHFVNALYLDMADLHHNTADGVHVASTGGVWSALVFGFGGMRDHDGLITFDPRLPEGWEALTFRVTLQKTRLRVVVTAGSIEVTVEDGSSARFSVRGREYAVSAGQPLTIPLDGQGPVRHGAPSQRALEGNVRDDGSLITQSIPVITDSLFLGDIADSDR